MNQYTLKLHDVKLRRSICGQGHELIMLRFGSTFHDAASLLYRLRYEVGWL